MAAKTVIRMLSLKEQHHPHDCAHFFQFLAENFPILLPVKYDNVEPMRQPFQLDDLQKISSMWHNGVFWKGTKPTSDGIYMSGRHYEVHDSLSLVVSGKKLKEKDYLDIISGIVSNGFKSVDIGCVNMKDIRDFEHDREKYFQTSMVINEALTTHDLKNGIPGLAWLTYFGKSYVELFGKEKLLSAPVYKTWECANGVFLQVTPGLYTKDEDYQELQEIKERAIEHLGRNAFAYYGDGSIIPEFKFERDGDSEQQNGSAPKSTTPLAYIDDEIDGLVNLLKTKQELPYQSSLQSVSLDSSVDSLNALNRYLDSIHSKAEAMSDDDLFLIVLRLGAYVGEVIRKEVAEFKELHWLDFDNAHKVNPTILDDIGHDINTAAVLYSPQEQTLLFPMNKVLKYAINGAEEDLMFYAKSVIDAYKQGIHL
tara:strand:- start:200 stop:1471 length:1272 start_codon:yes stop_codon:yes gene_type:complete